MITFIDFIQLRENDQAPLGQVPMGQAPTGQVPSQGMAPSGQMPMAQAAGAGAGPVQPGDGNEDKVYEDISNSLRKILEEKLFPALDKNSLNKDRAMSLLQTLIAQVSNRYGLNANNVMSAGRNAMTTNSEPRSPIPTQPTATG
jgi:hypothetical protein